MTDQLDNQNYTSDDDADTTASTLLAIGTILDGKYQITAFLGHGGMGSVYKARHLEIGNDVAIKILLPKVAIDQEAVRRFQMEARTIARLRHKNILTVFAFGSFEGLTYMAMEFIKGESLSELIFENGPMEPRLAIPLLLQICQGMTYAHQNGVLHRDLKPANVVILTHGVIDPAAVTTSDIDTITGGGPSVKVVDFGLAKILDGDEVQKLTQTGQVVGDPNYMSPEQCQGHNLDERSDIYSMGCLMYELFSGEKPFPDDNPVTILFKQVTNDPQPFANQKHLSQTLEAITFTCMAKDPADRYDSFDALAHVLQQYLENPSLRLKAPSLRHRYGHHRSKLIWGAIFTLIIGAVATVSWLYFYNAKKAEKEQAAIAREEKLHFLLSEERKRTKPPSIDEAQALVKLAEQSADRGALAQSRAMLADILAANTRYDEAYAVAVEALNMPELPQYIKPQTRHNAAYSAFVLHRYPEASYHYRLIYQSIRQARYNPTPEQGSVVHNLTTSLLAQNKLAEAEAIMADLDPKWIERNGVLNRGLLLQIELWGRKGNAGELNSLRKQVLESKLNDKDKSYVLLNIATQLLNCRDMQAARIAIADYRRLGSSPQLDQSESHNRLRVLEYNLELVSRPGPQSLQTGQALFAEQEKKPTDLWSIQTCGSLYKEDLLRNGQKDQAAALDSRIEKSVMASLHNAHG